MSGPRPFLTIGIPTYNRSDSVTRRVQEILDLSPDPSLSVLVIDNASPDGTFEQLIDRYAGSGIKILRNSSNLGYAGNIFRLIDEADSEYLLILSDEDRLNGDALAALIDLCRSKSPLMVSPRAQVGTNSNYRGRSSTREIAPDEFESASFYVSGLTFDLDAVRQVAEVIRTLIPANSAATVYPQVLLTSLLVAQGSTFFLDAVVSSQIDELESHITEPTGSSYRDVGGRWAQFRGYEEFFAMDHSEVVGPEGVARLKEMRNHARSSLLPLLLSTAIAEQPSLREALWRSSVRFAIDGLRDRAVERLVRFRGRMRKS